MASAERLTVKDWMDAAYERFQSSGLGGVRVEIVARDLGATKGSFYWHFANRSELVQVVMARWEERETEQIIQVVQPSDDAKARLWSLFEAVAERIVQRDGEATLYVEARGEGVQDVVARVSARRINYVAAILIELGIDKDEAERRAAIALAAVLGIQQLTRGAGSLPVTDASTITATAIAMMTAPSAI